MPNIGLRRVRVSFASICLLYAVAAASAWGAGAMDDVTFWQVLLLGEVTLVANKARRPGVLQGIASRRWVVRVAEFVLICLAAIFAFIVVATIPLAVADIVAFIPVPFENSLHHWVMAPALISLAIVALFLWNNRDHKIRVLDECGHAISKTSECLRRIETAADIDEARAIGGEGLTSLLATMLQPHSVLRPQKSMRAAFVLVLDPADRRYHVAFMHSEHREYGDLFDALRPAAWCQAEVDRLKQELQRARGTLKGQALRQREGEIRKECETCASITGHADKYPGLHIYPDVTDEFFKSEAYLDCFPAQDRERLAFRSKAAIRLQLGSQRVGVLLLTDSAVAGFMNPDKSPIEMLSPLVALLFDRVWSWRRHP